MADEVFFLGSGFSKSINENYPLLSELTEILLGKNLEYFGDPYKNKLPNSCTNNFENLMTYLASDLPWKTEINKAHNNASYVELTQNIVNYFNTLEAYDIYNDDFKSFWTYIYMECIPIITLNYDLIPEKNLNLLKHQISNNKPGLVLADADSCEDFYRGNVIDIKNKLRDITVLSDKMPEIIKLHGSVNWFYVKDNESSQIYCANCEDDESKLLGQYNPLIIPPVLDKTAFYNNLTIRNLWQKAFKYLSEAKNIYIIGFSLPKTDMSVRFLFESALKVNKNNSNIYIIDKNSSDDFKNKYIDLFGEKCNFDYCGEDAVLKFVNEIIVPKVEKTYATK